MSVMQCTSSLARWPRSGNKDTWSSGSRAACSGARASKTSSLVLFNRSAARRAGHSSRGTGCEASKQSVQEPLGDAPKRSKDAKDVFSVGTFVEQIKTPAALIVLTALALTFAGDAFAAGFGDSFVGGGGDGFGPSGGFDDEEYIYTTKDLAVDVASPLVAYKLVTAALKQDTPKWLDAIILLATLGAAFVVFTGVDTLDAYLK